MNRLIHVALAALASFTAVTPLLSCASENQLIDDFWMRDKSTTAPARSAPPPTSTRSAPAMAREPAAVSGGGASATAQGGAGLVPAVQGLPPDPGDSGTYRLAPGDVIKVQVFQVDELSSEERVSEDGEIVMPLIGPVPVGGMTPKAAEAHIAGILGKDYLQNPQVDIYVTESANQQITVMGSVNKPGCLPRRRADHAASGHRPGRGHRQGGEGGRGGRLPTRLLRCDACLCGRSKGDPAGRSGRSSLGRGRSGGRAAVRKRCLHSRGDGHLARIRALRPAVLRGFGVNPSKGLQIASRGRKAPRSQRRGRSGR